MMPARESPSNSEALHSNMKGDTSVDLQSSGGAIIEPASWERLSSESDCLRDRLLHMVWILHERLF